MMENHTRILVVADDTEAVSGIIHHLLTSFDADITLVEAMAEVEQLSELAGFDLILAQYGLRDGRAIDLLDLLPPRRPPLVLFQCDAKPDAIIEAVRRGAADVLPAPIDLDDLTAVICRVLHRVRLMRSEQLRTRRLRSLSSQLIKERRDLRKRIDLICHDIVDAYRRLAERVVSTASVASQDASFEELN